LTELQKGMTLMNRNLFNRGLWGIVLVASLLEATPAQAHFV